MALRQPDASWQPAASTRSPRVVVWADDLDVTRRRWNWRQGAHAPAGRP